MVTLGNVRASQRRWDDSLEFHQLALAQYISTLGQNHFRVAALQSKLGEHHVRRGDVERARSVAFQFLSKFPSPSLFLPPVIKIPAASLVSLSVRSYNLVVYTHHRSSYKTALKIYSDRSYYALEIANTTFKLADVLSLLNQYEEAKSLRRKAEASLLEVGRKRGRRIKREDLDGLVAFWSA